MIELVLGLWKRLELAARISGPAPRQQLALELRRWRMLQLVQVWVWVGVGAQARARRKLKLQFAVVLAASAASELCATNLAEDCAAPVWASRCAAVVSMECDDLNFLSLEA